MDYVTYKDGYKYQLVEDYSIQIKITGYVADTPYLKLTKEGLLTLKAGYASDGPSGPTFDTKNSIRGGFVHDALYWLMRNNFIPLSYKGYIDKLFQSILIEDRMWKARAWIWYQGVHRKGIEHLYPSCERPALRAP